MFFVSEAKNEAMASADAHVTNAGLPAYGDLLALVHRLAYPDEGELLRLEDYRNIARNKLEPDGCRVLFP